MSTDPYVVRQSAVDEYRRKFDAKEREEKELIERLGGDGAGPIDIVRAAAWTLPRTGHAASVEDLATACGYLADAHGRLDLYERDIIEGLLDAGQSWGQIAKALDRKGAASARLRYRKLGGRRLDSAPDTPVATRNEEEQ